MQMAHISNPVPTQLIFTDLRMLRVHYIVAWHHSPALLHRYFLAYGSSIRTSCNRFILLVYITLSAV